jgi:DeoR/GlpR family transcriptional regulator of sugar metabolism
MSMSDSDVLNLAPLRRGVGPAGGTTLLAEARRSKILAWLHEEGSARVRDLAEAFGVSEATVRQDLERLDADGHITREHGGAFLKSLPQQVKSLTLQNGVNLEAKKKIGQKAASFVDDFDTIILDSGSTTTEMASSLLNKNSLNVITNSLNIALALGAVPTCSVHMPGGQFKAPTLSLSGEKSAEYFTSIYAEKLFLATAAISFEAGLTYPSMADLYVKRAMVAASSKVYLLADSSKIGRTSLSSLGPLSLIHTLITDSGIQNADRKAFEAEGIEVIIA